MNLLAKLELIQRVDALIRRKGTGTPTHLSDRLGISKRNVFNLINTMKEMGAPIYFCKNRNSYCYEEEVTFSFGFISNQRSIYGGKSKHIYFDFQAAKKIHLDDLDLF
jgi:hypothetical protein